MFPAIPGHCSAPLPSTHKQSKSIIDEALPPLSSAVPCCQSVGRPWSKGSYKQPPFHYSYGCFNEEVDLTLFTLCPCKQPRLLPHHSHFNLFLFPTVVCWSSFLLSLIIQPASLSLHPLTITFFTSFKGCEGIPASKVVLSRQCSTGIWLSFLGRERLGLRDLAFVCG